MDDDGIINEGYTNENDNNNKRPRRVRKRDNPGKSEVPKVNEVNNQPNNPEESVNPKRERRRRRKSKQNNETNDAVEGDRTGTGGLGLDQYLNDLQDDVETRGSTENLPTINISTLRPNGGAGIHAGLGDSVFIEGPKRFRQENHEKFIRNKLRDTQQATEQNNQDRLSISNEYNNDLLLSSIGINENYHIFSTFMLGLLAGLKLMHVIVIFTIIDTTNSAYLLAYLPLQRPLYILFFVFFVIVSVSVWDRLNIGQEDRKWDSSQIAILVALILLLIAFIIQNTLYLYDSNFFNLNLNKGNAVYISAALSIVSTWRILNCVIAVLVTLSWFIIATIPTFNSFVLNSKYYLLSSGNNNENYNDFIAANGGSMNFR